MPRGERKLDFAKAQLGRTVLGLLPADRLGLMVFSGQGQARQICPIAADPHRAAFIQALHDLKIENQTDILGALNEAARILESDPAEERVIVLISDGEQNPSRPVEELIGATRKLCPASLRTPSGALRTRLHTFGLEVGLGHEELAGERLLKTLAKEGGGEFFPDFGELGKKLTTVIQETRKDLWTRSEPFAVHARHPNHPVLKDGFGAWPLQRFRNRLKARPSSTVLTESLSVNPGAGDENAGKTKGAPEKPGKPDPLLMLGRAGLGRTAQLALTLEGTAGEDFVKPQEGWKGGTGLLARILSWAEFQDPPSGKKWTLELDLSTRAILTANLQVKETGTDAPVHGLRPSLSLEPAGLDQKDGSEETWIKPFTPTGPGRYQIQAPKPGKGIFRVKVLDEGAEVLERFLTVSFPPELARFGTDRIALKELVRLAGGDSRMIESPGRDVAEWLEALKKGRGFWPAWPAALGLAALFFLLDLAARGIRASKKRALPPHRAVPKDPAQGL